MSWQLYYNMSDDASQKDLDPPSAKKIKIVQENKDNVVAEELELKDFVPEKIVNNNTNRKTVCIKGSFKGKSGVALVFFEKNAFKEEDLDDKGYFSIDTEVHRFFQNDIYGNYECFPKTSINGVKSTIIYPATNKHIEKYAIKETFLISETPELYEKYTLPQILKADSNLQWIYNILEGKSEQDRIVHINPDPKEGFVLLPDLKWDGVTKETLYLLALVQPKDIKSLRDLDERHLPLLKRVRDEGKKAIYQKYGVPGGQLRIYLHYQPSFYHLHIHFNSLKHEAPGIYADRAHLLDTVINNIEMMSNYYKQSSIPFTVREMDMFFEVYETNGYIQRIKSDIELIDKARLRSCNVYITTSVDFNKTCNLKVSIQTNCIVLNYYNDSQDQIKRSDSLSSIESLSDCYSDEESGITCIIPVEEFFHIIPNSMSCLKINKNTISFRILTEPDNGGNFYTEILTAGTIDKAEVLNTLKINLKCEEQVKLVCGNCCNVISDSSVKFDRMLELPTSNLDMSEWFCHGHGHGQSPSQVEITPNKLDFLYRLTFFVVNTSILSQKTNKFNSKRDVYHCNRCLAWLGMKKNDTVKLFNSDVKILREGSYDHIFSHKNSIQDISVDDFIYTIECMCREFSLGLQYTVMYKIVMECTLANTSKQFLLLWIMDKELQVLRNKGNTQNDDKMELQSSFLTKILFKVESSLNEEVETWLSDPGVVSTDVSKNMFLRGVEHLQNMSLKVPESFRNTNGFCVSYLKV